MKNIKLFSAIGMIFLVSAVLHSCKEVGPVLPWGGSSSAVYDTTYLESQVQTPMPKYVLIEDVTGVSCPNCPLSHSQMDSLMLHNNIIGICSHVGQSMLQQDAPIISNPLQVLTCTDAQSIAQNFGFPASAPYGMVDRLLFSNGNAYSPGSLWNYYSGWDGDANTELIGPPVVVPPVNIYITPAYSSTGSTRQIAITIAIHYTTSQPDTDKLSVFLTEDSIVTAQELPDQSVDTFYVHDHVMRASVSSYLGDILNAPSIVAGRVFIRTYNFTIPATVWNPQHMNVVAFVNRFQHGNNNILQAAIAPLFPHSW